MRRQVEKLQSYTFSSDFLPPEPETENRVSLTVEELAALLEDARRTTAEMVRDETLSLQAEKLSALSDTMREALLAVSSLASHLEKAAIDEHDRLNALNAVRHLARSLVDGQGELFAKGASHSQTGNHSGEV